MIVLFKLNNRTYKNVSKVYESFIRNYPNFDLQKDPCSAIHKGIVSAYNYPISFSYEPNRDTVSEIIVNYEHQKCLAIVLNSETKLPIFVSFLVLLSSKKSDPYLEVFSEHRNFNSSQVSFLLCFEPQPGGFFYIAKPSEIMFISCGKVTFHKPTPLVFGLCV
jgi:hypothetical protein